MSKRLIKVAEANTLLDSFNKPQVGYKFTFRSVPISQDWIRVIRKDWDEADFGEPEVLETRELSALARLRLEESLPF